MDQVVEMGNRVSVDYTGTLLDGTEFDTTIGQIPLEFKVGSTEVIPGFSTAVVGMQVGESKKVTIPCAEAYGERKEDRLMEVPRSKFPPQAMIKPRGILKMQSPEGSVMNMRVLEVNATTVVLDANHPLAGQDLVFDIKLLAIIR